MTTQDIDLAAEGGAAIALAVSPPARSAPEVRERLELGFVPVPQLDPREPSTSSSVRGQAPRVDLLTPLVGKPHGLVLVPAFGASAQPLRFLDYLIAEALPAPMVGLRAMALVAVPQPARFALHKLLVSESRPAAFATKAEKDRAQAIQVLEVLAEEAPDGVADAKADLARRGQGWLDKLARALAKVARRAPEVARFVARST